jgi:hypothetical protein
MKKIFRYFTKIGSAVALGLVLGQMPSAQAGWTGNVNGTGFGWAQSSVTSVTTNYAVAVTATNVATKNPSAAIQPVTGYIATAALPKGASPSTYSKTLTGTGYKLQNATVAAGGDKTDDPLLSTVGSQFVSGTFLQVLGYNTTPGYDTNTSYYTFNIYTVGTDSGFDYNNWNQLGAAQLVRVLDMSLAPGFDPTKSVIIPGSDPYSICWNTIVTNYSEGGYFYLTTNQNCVPTWQVQVGGYSQGGNGGEGEGFAQILSGPSPYGGGSFNSWGGWQLSDSIYSYYEATNDPSYVFLDFHGTTASLPPGPGDTLITKNLKKSPGCTNATIWFSSSVKLKWPCKKRGNISFVNQIISGLDGQPPISVPDAQIVFDATVQCTTTVFTNNMWVTTAPLSGSSGNLFLSAVNLPLPNGLPNGNKNVTWSGTFVTDTQGVKPKWKWSATFYKGCPCNLGNVDVKESDDNNNCRHYGNSDCAGTPENLKSLVSGGASDDSGDNSQDVNPHGP